MLDEKIVQLKAQFVDYGVLIENILLKACKGLSERKSKLLQEIIEIDELKSNNAEIEIDELCMNIIAQFQPKAKNLRIIIMISKINCDLERIGDQVVNISQSALSLLKHEEFSKMVKFHDMFNQVISMYRNSIQSFIGEDTSLARQV